MSEIRVENIIGENGVDAVQFTKESIQLELSLAQMYQPQVL